MDTRQSTNVCSGHKLKRKKSQKVFAVSSPNIKYQEWSHLLFLAQTSSIRNVVTQYNSS
uniref:Uncharacterized protein n=1 Tax=Arion vulgaris TaxID=1028688 RepID=A0A0B6YSX2_9EUPU